MILKMYSSRRKEMCSKFKISLTVLILMLTVISCERYIPTDTGGMDFPPAVPENVQITRARDGEITLEWQYFDPAYVKKFNIYRAVNDSTKMKYYSFTNDLYFIDDSLNYDSLYFYSVSAIDGKGRESALSKIVSAKPVNYYKPFPPYLVNINARNWNDTLSVFLSWQPSYDSDVDHYNVYRGIEESFKTDKIHLVGNSKSTVFVDRNNLKILKYYYYKLRAVDKGGLIGNATYPVKDVILDAPKIIFPNGQKINGLFFDFKFLGCGLPARYKIVIQSSEQFGSVDEINLSSFKIHDTLSVNYYAYYLMPGKTYYWRVGTYSGNNDEVNSYSKLGSFSMTGR